MKYWLLPILLLGLIVGCSQKKLSEHDKEVQQQQQHNNLKKAELLIVAGTYLGKLTSTTGLNQDVKLVLEVKDVPEDSDKPDSKLTPKLLGSLRFLYGDESAGEYTDCLVKSADFSKVNSQLAIVVTHEQFGEMVVSAIADGNEIKGNWNAGSVGASGGLNVTK